MAELNLGKVVGSDAKINGQTAITLTGANGVSVITSGTDVTVDGAGIKTELTTHTSNTDIHVTAEEKAVWNGKADLSDIPTTLPANGGNADTLDGKHADNFALAENKFMDDYLSSKTGDIRALVIDLPSGGFGGNTDRLPNITGFPITGDIIITWSKSVYSNGFRYGTLQVRSMRQSNLPVYQCSVYNDGVYTDWQKLCDGGNADTVDGLHAADLFQKSEGLRSENMYHDIFSTTLTSDHPCWNKHCFVVGQSSDPDSEEYIDNAPEINSALWYEVFTCGRDNRAYQIAFGCFRNQRKTFIRYMHDEVWSDWKNIADGGNADTVDGKHASDFASSDDNYFLYTLDSNGNKHGPSHLLRAQFNVKNDSRFYIQDEDGHQVRVNYADNADTLDGLHANEIASNPNLLINPDFKINQRGQSEYTSAGYTVDRWATQTYCKVTVKNGGGVRLDSIGAIGTGFYQAYDGDLSGNTVTLSIKASGSGSLRIGIWDTSTKTVTLDDTPAVYSHTFEIGNDATFGMWLSANGEYAEIEWVKLELGNIATPFVPPETTTELLKCRRYYQKLCFFRVPMAYHDTSIITWFIPFVPMRTTPTVVINTDGMYIDGMPSGSQPTDFAVVWAVGTDTASASGCIRVNCSYDSSWDTFIANGSWNAPLTANSNSSGLLLDAELL